VKAPRRSSTAEPIPLGKLELLDRVRRCLRGKSRFESESDYLTALEEISLLLNIVVNQALRGDELSCRFLAVVMNYLGDQKARLEQANPEFERLCAKLESARRATKRSGGLRERIEEVMFAAKCTKEAWQISKQISRNNIDPWASDAVKLPSPDSRSGSAITEWSNYVYSEFRKIRLELAEQPGIGDRKRYQVDGKFYVSRLRSDIRDNVKRIFRIWESENVG
jgi:hypothetical protein